MILDGHIHIGAKDNDHGAFAKELQKAGISGGILTSTPPAAFASLAGWESRSCSERLDSLCSWCKDQPDLYP